MGHLRPYAAWSATGRRAPIPAIRAPRWNRPARALGAILRLPQRTPPTERVRYAATGRINAAIVMKSPGVVTLLSIDQGEARLCWVQASATAAPSASPLWL